MLNRLNVIATALAESALGARLGLDPSKAKVAIIVAGVATSGVLASAVLSGSTPDCSSSETRALVEEIARGQPSLQNALAFAFMSDPSNSVEQGNPPFDQDPEYVALRKQVEELKLQKDAASAKCMDDTQHPPEITSSLSEYSLYRSQICSPGRPDVDINYYLSKPDETGYEEMNAAYNHFFKYASENVYPLMIKTSEAEAKMEAIKGRYAAERQSQHEKRKNEWASKIASIEYDLSNIITTSKDQELGSFTCKASISASVDGMQVNRSIKYKSLIHNYPV